MVEDSAFSNKIDYVAFFWASKSHYWFKSNGNIAEWVDFACWLSCIGKGLRAACKAGFFVYWKNQPGRGKAKSLGVLPFMYMVLMTTSTIFQLSKCTSFMLTLLYILTR